MTRSLTTSLFALCMIVGCDEPKSSLGGLPATDTGAATDAATETSFETAAEETSAASATATGTDARDLGAPCQTAFVPEARLLETGNAECGSGMCLYADDLYAQPGESCSQDSDCSGFGSGVICNPGGQCELDPQHIEDRSMCTELCEQDSDCVGADGTACEGGFACVPISSIGEVCCQSVCACLDDVDLASAQELQATCEAGTTPGCCDQGVPGPGCGG